MVGLKSGLDRGSRPAQPAVSRDPFHTVGGNVIWYSHCGEQFAGSFKKKIDISYDLVIPHLGTYPDKTLCIRKGTRTPMFLAVEFTIAKTWQQPKCPPTVEWMRKMRRVYLYMNLTQP